MNHRELIRAVAAQTGLDPREVESVLRGTSDVIAAVVATGEPVTIAGFAKFMRVERPIRTELNSGRQPPRSARAPGTARIIPLEGLRDAVVGAVAAPKLEPGVWPSVPSRPRQAMDAGSHGDQTRASISRARRRVVRSGRTRGDARAVRSDRTGHADSTGRPAVSSGQQPTPRPRGRNGKRSRLVTESSPDQHHRWCGACGQTRPAADFAGQFGGGICERCRERATRAKDAAKKKKTTKRRSVWTVAGGGFESNRRRH